MIPFEISNFSGLNKSAHPTKIAPGEAVVCENVDVSKGLISSFPKIGSEQAGLPFVVPKILQGSSVSYAMYRTAVDPTQSATSYYYKEIPAGYLKAGVPITFAIRFAFPDWAVGEEVAILVLPWTSVAHDPCDFLSVGTAGSYSGHNDDRLSKYADYFFTTVPSVDAEGETAHIGIEVRWWLNSQNLPPGSPQLISFECGGGSPTEWFVMDINQNVTAWGAKYPNKGVPRFCVVDPTHTFDGAADYEPKVVSEVDSSQVRGGVAVTKVSSTEFTIDGGSGVGLEASPGCVAKFSSDDGSVRTIVASAGVLDPANGGEIGAPNFYVIKTLDPVDLTGDIVVEFDRSLILVSDTYGRPDEAFGCIVAVTQPGCDSCLPVLWSDATGYGLTCSSFSGFLVCPGAQLPASALCGGVGNPDVWSNAPFDSSITRSFTIRQYVGEDSGVGSATQIRSSFVHGSFIMWHGVAAFPYMVAFNNALDGLDIAGSEAICPGSAISGAASVGNDVVFISDNAVYLFRGVPGYAALEKVLDVGSVMPDSIVKLKTSSALMVLNDGIWVWSGGLTKVEDKSGLFKTPGSAPLSGVVGSTLLRKRVGRDLDGNYAFCSLTGEDGVGEIILIGAPDLSFTSLVISADTSGGVGFVRGAEPGSVFVISKDENELFNYVEFDPLADSSTWLPFRYRSGWIDPAVDCSKKKFLHLTLEADRGSAPVAPATTGLPVDVVIEYDNGVEISETIYLADDGDGDIIYKEIECGATARKFRITLVSAEQTEKINIHKLTMWYENAKQK